VTKQGVLVPSFPTTEEGQAANETKVI
jgi:hypothetical protein